MKKKIVFLACALFVIGAGCLVGFSASNEKDAWYAFGSSNTEALTDCEITNGKGTVIFSCKGAKTCSETYLGKTLTCDGTKQ